MYQRRNPGFAEQSANRRKELGEFMQRQKQAMPNFQQAEENVNDGLGNALQQQDAMRPRTQMSNMYQRPPQQPMQQPMPQGPADPQQGPMTAQRRPRPYMYGAMA